ncbi:hypothetical protein ABIE91_003010 [Bradyrhizobium elkanii]|nr:hypothetical protein [Bradyrhizobium elkanii]WLA82122.1 hypothetical protein QNJ99_43395 [Bradyrhizobium elkanii]
MPSRGIGDQHVADRLDAAEPAAGGGAGGERAAHLRCERIVAAGIEDDEAETSGVGDLQHHALQADRFIGGVGIALQFGIDRDQPVVAVDLHAVAGEVHRRHVGARGIAAECDQPAPHLVEACIGDERHGNAEALQRGCDIAGIIWRIGQRRHAFVGAVADHQRHPPAVGRSRRGEACKRRGNGQSRDKRAAVHAGPDRR